MPDGTSLIFDSKAFKLGEFSTVLARWHDLSEKDTERIVWFAASGGPWTISGPAEVPENLCCPISMELMKDPMM